MDLYEYDRIKDIIILNKENHDSAYKVNINPYIIMDVSQNNVVCGIKITNASQVLHLTRDQIKKAKIYCIVENEYRNIVLTLKLNIPNNKKEFKISREFNTDLIGNEFYFK